MCEVHHCINYLLPEVKTSDYSLRERGHHYELPSWHYNLFRNSFVIRCLFKFMWLLHVLLYCCNAILCIVACTSVTCYYRYIHTWYLLPLRSCSFYHTSVTNRRPGEDHAADTNHSVVRHNHAPIHGGRRPSGTFLHLPTWWCGLWNI